MKLNNKLTKDWLDFKEFQQRYQNIEVEEYPNRVLDSNPKPVISIQIVTYQHKNFIKKAIESVISQKIDFQYEIILGDDDSTDGTREICIEYAKKYPEIIRLFLHKRENNIKILGRASGMFQIAYNTYKSRGDYISIMGGDDYWSDNKKISKQISHLEKNNHISFNYHDHLRIFSDSNNKVLKTAERIQTIVGRHLFRKLPKEFLELMQEDSFFKFFWKIKGPSAYLENIGASVVLFHPNSMYTSLQRKETYKQMLNLREKIVMACRNDLEIQAKAQYELFRVIFDYYRNSNIFLPANMINFIGDLKKYNNKHTKLYYTFILFLLKKLKVIRNE